MEALEKHRKAWPGKSDEWLFERLDNELKQKVETIADLKAKAGQHETIVIGMNEFIEDRIKFWDQYGDNGRNQVRELKVIRKKLKGYQ